MYNKAKCRVKLKGKVGDSIDSKFGVLQGEMLSPELFKIFLSDLHEYLSKEVGSELSATIIFYILYADDLILIADSVEVLQRLIDGLLSFCKKWHIVSLTKTKVMVFNKKNVGNIKCWYNGNHIEIVTQYKYVGTIFSSKHQDIFKSNKLYLAHKAQNALFTLNSDLKNSVNDLLP